MKKYLILLFVAAAAVFQSCDNNDDLWDAIDDLKGRVQALETQVDALNNNVEAMKALYNEGATISEVSETDGTYTLKLTNGTTLTLTQGSEAEAVIPVVSIDAQGNWQYTVDGGKSFISLNVNAVAEDGVTPQFRVDETTGVWQINTTGEESGWTNVKNTAGEDVSAIGGTVTDKFFDSVRTEGNVLYIKLLGGEKVIGDWFRTARQAAPDLPLYINDFGILVSADKPEDEHRKHYHEVISRLLQEKAPLGGIGMQSHFTDPQAPENMLKILDEYGKYGLPIKLTEYDFNTFDEALAGDYMRDILYVAFSHPAVEGFLMWGFWDGQHWLGNAPIFRADWSLKPSGKVFDELVHHRWSTRLEGKSDATGIYAGRGFYGDYRVSVTTGDGKTVEVPFTLEPGITNYTVKVK